MTVEQAMVQADGWMAGEALKTLAKEVERLRDRDRRFVLVMKYFGVEFQEDMISDLMKIVEEHDKAASAAGGKE